MKTRSEALAAILGGVHRLGPESVSLADARGRVVAEALVAAMPHPPFAQSAMDGWSVCASDVAGANEHAPVRLPIAGESRAGGVLFGHQQVGTAVRIFTGAPLPSGADGVVVQEDAFVEGGDVLLKFPAKAGHNVRGEGTSRAKGSILVGEGLRVDAGVVSAFASEGRQELLVTRRPNVALITTGDEVHPLGTPLPPGRVFNSNAPMLSALVEEAGGRCEAHHCEDSVQAMTTLLGTLENADLILTCGGASVGDHDIVREALAASGAQSVFWKVAVKPGKPVAFAVRDEQPVLSLPGNPVSAFVAFHLFAAPAIRKMTGAAPAPWSTGVLHSATTHRTGREEFIRAKVLQWQPDLLVAPFDRQNSGAMHDLALADALVRLPAEQERFAQGCRLEMLLLRPRAT